MEDREMTLEEWCNKLPEFHLVNKQLRELKAPLIAQTEPVAEVPCSTGLSDLVAKWEAKIADYEIRIADAAKIGNDHGQWTLSVRQGELMGALRELQPSKMDEGKQTTNEVMT